MNKTTLMNNMTRTFNRANLKLKKYSPEILVVSGIVGVVTSAVMACKATTKVESVLADHRRNLESVDRALEHPAISREKYSEEDAKKDIVKFYAKTGLEFVKLYGPSVSLGVVSIASILAGHNILRKRNVAIAAAYATVDQGFKEYRNRVITRFGEELDRELKYNIKAETIQETVVDENGKEKTVEKTIEVANPLDQYSCYSCFFTDGCKGYSPNNPELNRMTLLSLQAYCNDRLKTKGYLFLNEVYEMLGVPRSKAGQIVGWIYDDKNPNHRGDNFVDFGLYDIHKENSRDFINRREPTILLDFNVDGNILDLI